MEANLLTPKQPTQKRGKIRVNAIREKAFALLEEQEIDQISISEIAKAAQVGVGTFYHYYPSKEALLLDLRALILQETAASLASGFKTPVKNKKAFLALFNQLLTQWLATLIKYQSLERAVWGYAFKNPDFAQALSEQETALRGLTQHILQSYEQFLRPANLDTVATTVVMWVDGTISRILRSEPLAQDHQWLIEELTRMLGHYLFPDEDS
jgi:AcrR family transcriptional regulator